MKMQFSILSLLFAPLLGASLNLFIAFFSMNEKKKVFLSGLVATVAMFYSFVQAVILFVGLQSVQSITGDVHLAAGLGTWLQVSGFDIGFNFRWDFLSGMMSLVITGVGAFIHLYSMGYMYHEHGVSRYFAYLNLFCFFMLMLVLATSLPVMFIGWEGVGLCSYLLISFWYQQQDNVKAANKAFIVNRVGDFFFLLGMFFIFQVVGSLEFSNILSFIQGLTFENIAIHPKLIYGAFCLFIGATGKSAQFPLYVWLPDAMAGPTPVSALIHAATMVTAGIYLLARLSPLYMLIPALLHFIAMIGLFTSLLAACMAVVQTDIKKTLAYSTISQLGLMFVACGVGAFSTALFHVITHAFFKALLFLGAGSVIHACHGEQNMFKMGGLKEKIPHTFLMMLIGCAALAGLPPLAGFFSKDEILYSVLSSSFGSISYYVVAQFICFLTALYSARLLALTFFGTSHMNQDAFKKVHESPMTMLIPLYVLSLGAVGAGLFGLPHFLRDIFFHVPHFINAFAGQNMSFVSLPESAYGLAEWHVSLISILVGGATFYGAFQFYKKHRNLEEFPMLAPLLLVSEKKFYVDEIYQKFIVGALHNFARLVLGFIDQILILKSFEFVGFAIEGSGRAFKKLQNGQIQMYLFYFCLGLVGVAFFLFL